MSTFSEPRMSTYNMDSSREGFDSEKGFKETFDFLKKPLITPDEFGERLREDLKRHILLNSLKDYLGKAWDDVPKDLFNVMRQGILLAKQEALIKEKKRIELESKLEKEKNEKEQKEKEKLRLAEEKVAEDLKRKAREEENRAAAKKREELYAARLKDERIFKQEAEKNNYNKQTEVHKTSAQESNTLTFEKNENPIWLKQEILLQAAILRKALFLTKSLVSSVESKAQFKKKRLELRKDIRPKLGQIVNSKKKVVEIVENLDRTLRDLKSTDRSLYFWTLNFISKQAIKQAETEFSINSATAFPVARVLIGLMQRHCILKDFLLVRFFKKCPYILPGSIPQLESDAASESYRKRLGFVKRDENEWEDNEHFILRQGGIFALYSSFFAYDNTDDEPNLFSLSDAWFWLHRFLSSPPNLASSIALNKLLEMCGFKLVEVYGVQAFKMFRFIKTNYISKLDDEYKAHNVRLEICVDGILAQGNEPNIPEGRNYPVGDGGKWVRTPFKSLNPNKSLVAQSTAKDKAEPEVFNEEDESDDGWGAFL